MVTTAGKRAANEVLVRQREAEAIGLRATGWTYDDIAIQLGWSDESTARKAVQRALDRTVEKEAATYRQLQLARLLEMEKVVWEVIRTTHFATGFGSGLVYLITEDGKKTPVLDDGPKLAAVDRLLKIEAQRTQLIGTAAPQRRIVEVISEDVVARAIRNLDQELNDLYGLSELADA